MKRMVFILLPCALASINGCAAGSKRQTVPVGFKYPEAPELVEEQQVQAVGCICGVIQNGQGDGVAAVLVELFANNSKSRLDAVFSNDNGHFKITKGSAQGSSYLLRFSKPGFNSVLLRVRLEPKTTQQITVVLPFSA